MSSQMLKQLKIKTSTVKRLKKEYISYQKQTKTMKTKLQTIESETQGQNRQIEIKKHKEFFNESESVLSNVKQKLIQSFEALAQFLNEKQGQEVLNGSNEKKQAEQTVLDTETFLQSIAQ